MPADRDRGLWYRGGSSVCAPVNLGKVMGEWELSWSKWDAFCGWAERVGEVIVHGGVATLVLRGPRGDGRAGV